MNYKFLLFALLLTFFNLGIAQKNNTDDPSKEEEKTVVIDDTPIVARKRPFNPLAPSRAAFYSAILPGLGQAYNRSYWKIPLVYAGLGATGYFYLKNDKEYRDYRAAFKRRKAGYTDDQYYDINGDGTGPDVTEDGLERGQEYYQGNRDLSLLIFVAIYALNIIDANVDAHLKQFSISRDLTLEPFLENTAFYRQPDIGLSLNIKF